MRVNIASYTLLFVGLFYLPASAQVTLNLRQTLQQVRTNSPALRVERLNINVAQADQVTANLRPNPLLNNQTLFQLTPTPGSEAVGLLSRQRRQFWIQATKEFDIYNKRTYRNRAAEANTNLAIRSVAETERNLLFDAANRYLDAWYARIQLALLQRAKANVDTLVQLNRVRLKNLVITTTDLTRTQLISDQYDLQTRTAQQDLRNRLNELQLVLGIADSVNVALNDSIIHPAFTNPLRLYPTINSTADSLLRLATANRTDVLAAEATIESAKRNVDLQQVLAKPRNEAGFIWNPQNAIPYAGVFLTIELPVYSRNQGEIQKSRVLQEQASQAATLVQTRIRSEVQTAYQSFMTSRQNIERYVGIRRDADQVLASVRYAYLRGATTLIDLLQAESSWFDTQTAYYQSLYTYRQNYVRLLYVTGQINLY
ncbi:MULTISPECIES: TolC family protein [unclassified Spirosoma]|uniref:TolC family protein n=1 Tax=unclassified Spirosoma TaxID=2621999 RepID=UPI000961103F|nr:MULTISPECIES: TolC family protein [unclassified Spirosoma]MBN8825937.1 TolC family protein [Spirosoma sp.]OJW70973.1 MAG: transporter [Spirosoma sp. 48-14]